MRDRRPGMLPRDLFWSEKVGLVRCLPAVSLFDTLRCLSVEFADAKEVGSLAVA